MIIKNGKAFTKEKKDLLFLHGYLSSGKSFSYQIPFFDKDFRVFAPDLKGFGDNAGMEYPYSLNDYVKEVKEYIKSNGLNKPHVIAHSFGARIAIKLASEDGGLLDKIVLTGAAGLKPRRKIGYYIKKGVFKTLKLIVPKEKLSSFYSCDYNNLSPVMKESFIKIVNEHLDCLLPKIENETLLVFGEDDKETPLYMARRLNKGIKNSKLTVIRGAGHFAFIDKPFRFNTEVREFLFSR